MKSSVVAAVVALGLLGLGCTAPAGEEELAQSSDGLSVPNPSGAYVANINANGTGCPAGTWDAAISDDGKAFTVTFSSYEGTVAPGQSFAIKDCTLSLDLRTPSGFSFSVSSFHYQGYALLDQPGMTAKQTAKYYFQGNPVPARENRTDLTGPYDDSYVFSDQIGVADLVWSPCGAQRTLNAQTRITLQNNPAKTGNGYLNTTSVDGDVQTVFRFGLSWRPCDGGGGGGGGGGGERMLDIHKAANSWHMPDYVFGLTPNEGAPEYSYQGVAFKTFEAGGVNRKGLYRCRLPWNGWHFISTDPGCEGQATEGQLGHVSTVAQPGLVAVHRCKPARGWQRKVTTNLNECNSGGFRHDQQLGFVAP